MAEPLGRELNLSYGGVRADHRGQHIFPKLVKKMTAKGVPLTAAVKHLNKSGTVDRLLKLGLRRLIPWLTVRITFDGSPGRPTFKAEVCREHGPRLLCGKRLGIGEDGKCRRARERGSRFKGAWYPTT